MTIRQATEKDFSAMQALFAGARERMRSGGNPDQWGERKPYPDDTHEDISLGRAYLLVDPDGAAGERILGTFVFYVGEDPNYRQIDGAWLDDAPYGVIHRIAGDGRTKGILKAAVEFARERSAILRAASLRIDTHERNLPMRHLLQKYGFQECGVIRLADGSPRLAYQILF